MSDDKWGLLGLGWEGTSEMKRCAALYLVLVPYQSVAVQYPPATPISSTVAGIKKQKPRQWPLDVS